MIVESLIPVETDAPIGWLGGKTKLRPTIINCMPPHHCYVEVFGGSATVFFGKPASLSRIEVINDIHEDLVNLMKVIAGTCFDESVRQEFIGYVRNMPAARAAFEDWKHWDRETINQLSPAQQAFRFYYLVKKGFSCTPTGGYEASPKTQNRYNQNTDFEPFTARFRSNSAQIERMDFRSLIEKWNQPDEEKKVFFFCDPPYFVADDTNYYEHVFKHQDHLDFKTKMDEIDANGNTFLITYDDHPKVSELYDKYYIYRTEPIIYQASQEVDERHNAKPELFITNYDIKDAIRKRDRKLLRYPKGKQIGDIFATQTPEDKIAFVNGYDLTLINKP